MKMERGSIRAEIKAASEASVATYAAVSHKQYVYISDGIEPDGMYGRWTANMWAMIPLLAMIGFADEPA